MNILKKLKWFLKNPEKMAVLLMTVPVFRVVPDKLYLKWLYRARMHKKLNLKDPKTFNEKLQWLKLYDRKPIYSAMVDKHGAKEYVAEKIGEEYIIPTLGVWDKFEDIDFDKLPDQFVLKCTHDSGGLVICRDKSTLNIERAKVKINKCLKKNYFWSGREWPYKNVKPRILAETYIEPEEGKSMTDYKFYCFHGEPKFLYVSEGLEDHSTAKISFVTLDWTFTEFQRKDFKMHESLPEKPKTFDKMIEVARELSKGHRFLRVDLYENKNQILFSELTFSPTSGLAEVQPYDWNDTIGTWLHLLEE